MSIELTTASGAQRLGIKQALKFADHNVLDYGADPTGIADSTAAILAADAAAEASGGNVLFPEGIIRIDGQLELAYKVEGAGIRSMRPRRWLGVGAWMDPTASSAVTVRGTIFDCRYPSGPAMLAKPRGFWEMAGISWEHLDAPIAHPFIKITNPVCSIHHNSFIGHSSTVGQDCVVDGIVFGGTTLDAIGNEDDSPFQGYGTVINENYFNRVRRVCSWQMFANDIKVRDNVVWGGCGGDAVFWFDVVLANQFSAGATVAGNTVEVGHYNRLADLHHTVYNKFDMNGLYDQIQPAFTAVAGTDICTTAYDFADLSEVFLFTDGTLPGALATLTPYYIIRLSSTTFKLATSRANAVTATAIDITSSGTGTHNLTHNDTRGLIRVGEDCSAIWVLSSIAPPNVPMCSTELGVVQINLQQGVESVFSTHYPLRSDALRSAGAIFDGQSGAMAWQTDESKFGVSSSDVVGLDVRGSGGVGDPLWRQQRNGSIFIGGTIAVGITTPTWYLTNAGVGRLGGGGNFLIDTGTGGSVLSSRAYRLNLLDHTSTQYCRFEAAKTILSGPVQVGQYTVGTLPSVSDPGAGSIIYVTDDANGATHAGSNGTNWRRFADLTNVA